MIKRLLLMDIFFFTDMYMIIYINITFQMCLCLR